MSILRVISLLTLIITDLFKDFFISDFGFTSSAILALYIPWDSLKTGLICEPYIYIRLLTKFFAFLTRRLSLFFILADRPGLQNLKGETLTLIMKKRTTL
jgi:hypothetical protein